MPSFNAHLLLADPALRQAVAEQLKLAQYVVTGETELVPPPPTAMALILDAAGDAAILAPWRAAQPSGCILQLGEVWRRNRAGH